MQNPVVVSPDWVMTGTAAHLEEQLTGFKFSGPGFYIRSTEFDLVTLVDPQPYATEWNQKQPKEALLKLHHYSCPFSDSVFGRHGTPPVRQDERQ